MLHGYFQTLFPPFSLKTSIFEFTSLDYAYYLCSFYSIPQPLIIPSHSLYLFVAGTVSLSPVLASPAAILGDDYSHIEGPILHPSSDSHSPESQSQASLSLPPLHPIFPAHSLEFSQVQQSFEPTRSFNYLFYHLSCFSLLPYILIFFLSSRSVIG